MPLKLQISDSDLTNRWGFLIPFRFGGLAVQKPCRLMGLFLFEVGMRDGYGISKEGCDL